MSLAILKWLGGSDTGLSSKAIALTALGAMPERPCAPSDGDDFGRCIRLIECAPEAASALPTLARDGGAAWAALVPRWDDISKAYHEEIAGQNEGGTYELMRSILDPIRRQQPGFYDLGNGMSMRVGR